MSALIRLISILCCLVLAASFAMFAKDQAGKSSSQTVAKIASEDDSSAAAARVAATAPPKPRAKHNGVRRAIDGANAKLVSPFNGVVASSSPWSRHISQAVLAFLVFGLGLGFLARYLSTRGL